MNENEIPNEFDNIDVSDDEMAPSQTFSDVPDNESTLSTREAGQTYNWNDAPEKAKAPPRVDLTGEQIIIEQADIILPPSSQEWALTRKKDKKFKYCQFVLYFDKDGQQEYYSGVRVFQDDKDPTKHGHPTITRDRKSQASKLIGLYADFKEKNIAHVGMKEFMAFLNSKPKAIIESKEVENPVTGDIIRKNFIKEFIK